MNWYSFLKITVLLEIICQNIFLKHFGHCNTTDKVLYWKQNSESLKFIWTQLTHGVNLGLRDSYVLIQLCQLHRSRTSSNIRCRETCVRPPSNSSSIVLHIVYKAGIRCRWTSNVEYAVTNPRCHNFIYLSPFPEGTFVRAYADINSVKRHRGGFSHRALINMRNLYCIVLCILQH